MMDKTMDETINETLCALDDLCNTIDFWQDELEE